VKQFRVFLATGKIILRIPEVSRNPDARKGFFPAWERIFSSLCFFGAGVAQNGGIRYGAGNHEEFREIV
jgi:hypothetical protein